VRVRSPRAGELAAALAADGATVTSPEAGMLEVSGTTAEHFSPLFREGRMSMREPAGRLEMPRPSAIM
jgi:ABC-2 type transport system ATP-binding protein